jgi:kynurenine formamidase
MENIKYALTGLLLYTMIFFGAMFIMEKSCDAIINFVDEKTDVYKNDDSVFYREFGYNPSDVKTCTFTIHDGTYSEFDVTIHYIDANNSVDKVSLRAFITDLFKTVDIKNVTVDVSNDIIDAIRSKCHLLKIEFKTL